MRKRLRVFLSHPPKQAALPGVERGSELEALEVGELDVREVGAVAEGVGGDGHGAALGQREVLRLPRQAPLADLQVRLKRRRVEVFRGDSFNLYAKGYLCSELLPFLSRPL